MNFCNLEYFFRKKQNSEFSEDFITNVLDLTKVEHYSQKVFKYYEELLKSNDKIIQIDIGAGSRRFKHDYRKVCDIAKISGTKPQYGIFYQKLISYFGIKKVIELGTSLGIASAYFSSVFSDSYVVSVEACPNTVEFTSNKLKINNFNNITLINKTFDDFFNETNPYYKYFDFAFIDGNHRKFAVLSYFEKLKYAYLKDVNIVVIDDINWSLDMHSAWQEIVKNNTNSTCLNLFRCGVVITGFNLPRGEFCLNFVKKPSEKEFYVI